MKNKKLFILSMLLMIVGNILADNISVNDVTLSVGEEKQISVNLTNTENNYVAFQFDLVLPAGVTVAKDNKGRFVASITEERNIDHTLTVGDVGSNTFRFLSYSGTNSEFYGKDGALLNITLKADDSFGYGDFTATIVNPKFTLSSGAKILLSEISFKISNPKPEEPITITAKNVGRKYGDANPAFEYDALPVGSSVNGVPEFTCTATPTSPVGQYEIVVSRGSITNENVVFVNGTLDVQKAPLTIKADDKQMTQGEPLPEFTATYTGFKNGETEAVLTKQPEFNCSATSGSPEGNYDIIPINAEAQNYDISYNKGILTITPPVSPVPEDKLTIDDVEINTGGENEMAINLNNPGRKYVAFQFDVVLPVGVSIAKDNKGRFVSRLNDDRTIDHTLTVSKVGSGNTYRLLAYSGTNAEFEGNNGTIVYITLKAEETISAGKYTATVIDQKFTVADGTKYSFDDTSFAITVIQSPVPEPITIKAKNVGRKYGDANPTFEYEVLPEGSSLSGEAEFSCAATPTSPVGQYEIVVSRGSIINENVVFVNGTLDVQKTPLTIKADDKEMKQGASLPEFTATYTGFKNNETEEILTKKPEFNCAATSDSPVGTYDIIALNAEAQNYDISYVNGTLTIVPVPMPDQKGRLSGEDIELKAGAEATESFSLSTFENKYVAFQFDLNLPSGITIAKDEKGLFVANLEDSRCVDHTLNVGEVGTSAYRILSYSGTNAEFSGNSGAIMSIQLKADNSMKEGKYDATITNMKFTLADGTKHAFDDASFIITITGSVITVKAKNATRKYGDANPTFEYEVLPEGSSLSGEAEFSCAATPTSPVGQYEIVVSRGSIINENVVFVNGTLDVQKTPLTIKADDKEMKQGASLPEFTATYTGFKNNETEEVLTKKPEFNCAATSDSPVGTYDIIALNAEAQNYDISYLKGTLTIIPVIVTVKVKDCSRLYGDENPTFEYTVEGGTLNAEPRISCYAYKSSNVGEYEIKITWGDYKDKDVNFVNGTLTVNPAPLTVAVGNYTKKQGKSLPEFEITYSGFKNNQSTYILEKKAVASCEATEESEPGEYEIRLSGAEAKNYEMVYQNGILTVIPPISVVFSNMVAGQLESNVASCGHSKMEIDELRISGQLNGTDIKYFREMIISGELTTLDIKDAKIVSGGEAYYEDFIQYYTKNDIIGNSMFEDCKDLMVLYLPNTAKKIEMNAISGCDYLKTLDLSEMCEEIESYAISNCKRLEQINIYSRLHTIGAQNFSLCPNLREFNVVENNNWYCSNEGVLFSKDKKDLFVYPMGKTDISYVIPEGTVQISESAFDSAILQEVYVPKTINRVGEQAFAWCKNLTSVWSYIENLDGVALGKDYYGKVNVFEYMSSECTWHVIKGTSEKYTSREWWVEGWSISEDIEININPETGKEESNPLYPNSAINPIVSERVIDGAWYTLHGVKLDGKPTKPGIYVHGGRKIVIK